MLSLHGRRGAVNTAVQTQRKEKKKKQTVELFFWKIRVTFVAVELIAVVSAVTHPVTLESTGNTGAVQTPELILRASRATCRKKASRSKRTERRLRVRRQHPTHLLGSKWVSCRVFE